MITKTTLQKSSVGERRGWSFSVFFNNRDYPNFISALYKTKREAQEQLQRYVSTGKFEYYGSAEK